MATDEMAARAWRLAGDALGVAVVAPATVAIDTSTVTALALLPHFGRRPRGTLVFGVSDQSAEDAELLSESGYYVSYVNDSYATYERELFVATLNDWGWTVASRPPPAWYSGEPWTP